MGGIIGGALGGYAKEAADMKGKGRQGLIQKIRQGKKKTPLTPPNASNTTQLSPMAEPSSFRKGGRVKKTGFAKVHRGEVVVPKKRARRGGKRR
jgi:hypothetical protein